MILLILILFFKIIALLNFIKWSLSYILCIHTYVYIYICIYNLHSHELSEAVSQRNSNNYLLTFTLSTDIDIVTNEYLQNSRKCCFKLRVEGKLGRNVLESLSTLVMKVKHKAGIFCL